MVAESTKTAKDYSGEMIILKEDLWDEVEKFRAEMKKRPAQMMVYPMRMEERTKLVFRYLKNDNPTEFLLNCEWEIELIGNDVTDKEKIDRCV